MGQGRKGPYWSRCSAMDLRLVYTQRYDDWCLQEYPEVCTSDDFDELTYLQIKDTNSNNTLTLSPSGDPIFQPNELKDSQFWYLMQNLDEQYGFEDFGFIGSKQDPLYHRQFLTTEDCVDASEYKEQCPAPGKCGGCVKENRWCKW